MMQTNALLPSWIKQYKLALLKADLTAAVLVAVMLVPQSMAYAMLAGLPPVFGLYAATLPLIAYAIFGSSRHLAVGPVAILSLLVAAACAPLAEPATAEYLHLVALIAVMAGTLQLALGLLRAGFLINFVSHGVVSGFISGAAVIIALSQLPHLLGVKIESGHSPLQMAPQIVRNLATVNLPTAGLGTAAIVLIAVMKKYRPHFPAALLTVIAGTAMVYFFQLDQAGVSIVGQVPGGLPRLTLPSINLSTMARLAPTTVVIVFIGYMESMAVAQWVATRDKYRISPDRELVALGIANLVAGLFSGYTVTGGFSRTAVNYQAGAKTPLATVVTATLVLLTLLFLTALFRYLPQTVLAAIIIVAVAGLIDIKGAVLLYRLKKADGLTLMITFLTTLTIGIEEGIIIGVIASLLLFIARSARPRTAVLGYLEDEGIYRDIRRFKNAVQAPAVVIIRVDASLYFANARFVESHIREELAERPATQWLILDMSGVNDIDGVAISTLSELFEELANRNIRIAMAAAKTPVRDILNRARWPEEKPNIMTFPSLEKAVRAVTRESHPQSSLDH